MERKTITQQIETLRKMDIFQNDSFYRETLDSIMDSSRKKPFKAVVVGEFSTGKSTFINALLGTDLLPHATQEVTAAITNIYNVSRMDKRYKTCDVTFYKGKRIKLDRESELMQYTTVQSKEANVVQDIRCVDYYANYMWDDIDMVLVDTPGLNGMADGHRELTLEEVKSADFCIYLIGIRGLADTDKIILKQLKYYQNKFVFVLNFIDQLKVSEGETPEERINEIKKLLDHDIFPDSQIQYQIFGVSSLKALASKDKNITRLYQNDVIKITESDRKKYYKESGFEELENYIKGEISNSTIEQICAERKVYLLCNLLEQVEEELEAAKNQQKRLQEEAGSSQGIKRLEEKLNYFIDISGKNKEKVLIYARSECSNIKREFLEYVKSELKHMKKKYAKILMQFRKYEELEDYINGGQLNGNIKVDADRIYDYVEENITYCFNGILNNILMRIQEYLKNVRLNKKTEQINFEIKKISSKQNAQIVSLESGLQQTRQNILKAQNKLKATTKDVKNLEKEYEAEQILLEQTSIILASKEEEQREKIQALGDRPKAEKRTEYTTEYYTDYEYWGGLGIFDALFGPKEVRRSKTVPHTIIDDSLRREWEAKRKQIFQATQGEIDTYRMLVDADKNRIKSIERVLKKMKGNQSSAQMDLEYYQKKFKLDIETLENLRVKANQELLNALKNSVQGQIEEYCDFNYGEIALIVKDYIEEVVDRNSELILKKTKQFYEERFETLLLQYKNEIAAKKQNVLLQYGDYSKQIETIVQIRKELANDK